MGAFWRHITGDSQLRWVGPEKGVIHLATAAVVNAVWDLWAKAEGKPLWKLLADMTPEQLVSCIDFRYITDALTPDEALAILRRERADQRRARSARLLRDGYPAYTTSAGWLGYQRRQAAPALPRSDRGTAGRISKSKSAATSKTTSAAAAIIREEIGSERKLMMDANQCWDVDEAIANMKAAGALRPLVDRRTDQPRRCPRPCRHRARGHCAASAWRPASTARTA